MPSTTATDRYAKIYRLKDYGLWEEAVEVAEKHHSIAAMAEVMVEEVRTLRSQVDGSQRRHRAKQRSSERWQVSRKS